MPSIKHHPRCHARTRSGRRCRRYVAVDRWTKKLRKRCRNHGGLSTGPKFPDGKERSLAAANAGLQRWREETRRKKAAGLIERFLCGRKPGPTKRQREEAELAAVEERERRRLAFEDARRPPPWPTRRGGSSLVVGLERLERHFIERLSDCAPPSREQIEQIYDHILLTEERFGRKDGQVERLECLIWAIDSYRDHQALKEVLAQLAQQRAARAAQTSALASDAATPALDQQPSADSTGQVAATEPVAHDDDKAAVLARLAAEADELIASIKRRYTESGCQIFDAELARARHLAKIKAASEGVEVTDQALRAAEIDVCRHKLEMIRASEAEVDAIKARYHSTYLQRKAKRARELGRGVPMTLPGAHPRYRLP